MRLFLDTDILLDVLLRRDPHFEDSAAVLDWAEAHPGHSAVSWHGMANLHYLSKNGAEGFIEELLGFVEVPRTGTEHLLKALSLRFSDLEDAMQVAAALLFQAQVLVTRNLDDYRSSPVKALPPKEVCRILALG
jgi:predicted nucleic acid-binding protein